METIYNTLMRERLRCNGNFGNVIDVQQLLNIFINNSSTEYF